MSVHQGRPQGEGRYAIVVARFNQGFNERLLQGALAGFAEHGIPEEQVEVAWVPGAVELPLVAQRFARSGHDAVLALGTVIRGDTAHFDYVCDMAARGCERVALDEGVPVIFGVLTCENVEQAMARAGAVPDNKGYEAALAALEMGDLLRKLPAGPARGEGRA